MKTPLAPLLLSCLTFCTAYGASEENYTFVWGDEFEYSGLPDRDKWSYDTAGNSSGWGNNELQFYTSARTENSRVENGVLIIEALKENYSGRNYTSARLITKNKGDWLYGRFEIKAKLPSGRGTWPAIWMLSTDWEYGGWPDSGEIDIMEHVGYDMNRIHGTIHTKDFNHILGTQIGTNTVIENAATEFHIYAMEWRPDRIDIWVDDEHYFSVTDNGTGFGAWPFDKRFHLILNIAIGGNWGGVQGVDDSIFPQRMEVDYVRVYSINDFDYQEPVPAISIPAIVQAEDYFNTFGFQLEDTSDVGGGTNVGFLTHADWAEYQLNAPTAGTYSIDLRYASPDGYAKVAFSTSDDILQSGALSATGGWQSWNTKTLGEIYLPTGESTLRMSIDSPAREDVNVNWFEVRLIAPDPNADPDNDGLANMMEAVLGTDPYVFNAPDSWSKLEVITQDDLQYLQMTHQRLIGGSEITETSYTVNGVTCTVEISPTPDETNWQSGTDYLEQIGEPIDMNNGTESVTIRSKIPMSDGRMFMRLKCSTL